ncbi:MAG: tetratricopeptide repeat protein [Limisphaerales bacterium]
MQEPEQSPRDFVSSTLPWLVFGLALAVYIVTLNHWVTIASLPMVGQITGWNWWSPKLQSPLLYLLTWPIRGLPVSAQPAALNIFSAACAAGTLGLLARSVALLPHDRTREQRQRERSDFSLLSIPSAWLPPVFAVLVCGLQRTFWENAVVATGESLDLLVFAYLIRCLLEYRLDPRESWLLRVALVYGLATADNWAMISFFPAFLGATIWIVGFKFFEFGRLARMVGFGVLGLLLYLFFPLLDLVRGDSALGFWPTLKYQWVLQRNYVLAVPRSHILICSLTSVLPVLIMGIRWPSSFGDISVVGTALTTLMFRVIHGMFLIACLLVAFDPSFSPRVLGAGLPLLTLYYLGALSVGYFSGYFLVVFREDPASKSRRHVSDPKRLANWVIPGAVWVACGVVSVLLIGKNLSSIRDNNGPQLIDLANTLTESLPARGAVVLSDDPLSLLLVQAALQRSGTPDKHVLLDTRSLQFASYHQNLARHYPGRWPDYARGSNVPPIFDSISLAEMVRAQTQSNEVYYLHPSFGYFFERLYLQPRGAVYQLKPYSPGEISPPPWTPQIVQENQGFWSKAAPALDTLSRLVKKDQEDPIISNAEFVGHFYSRALDFWGVELQRAGQLKDAGKSFELALALNPKNIAAKVNREFNSSLVSGQARTVDLNKSVEERLGQYRNWDAVLQDNGPFDEANFCFTLARQFVKNGLSRQAALNFNRALTLNPDNVNARFELANVYLQTAGPDRVLRVVNDIQAYGGTHALSSTNQVELACLEASAYYMKTNYARAEGVLRRAETQFPNDAKILDMLSQIYLLTARYDDALRIIDQQLARAPNTASTLLAKSVVLIQSGAYQAALAPLDRVLAVAAKNSEPYIAAMLNRAIANLQIGQLDAAKRDYETLVQVVPNSYRVYFGLGEIAHQRKDASAETKYYELYLKYVPPPATPDQAKEQQLVIDRLKESKKTVR